MISAASPWGRETPRRAAAYHESGHAVACWRLGLSRIRLVTIEADEQSLGRVINNHLDLHTVRVHTMSPQTRDRLERHILSLLAGGVAERLVCDQHVGPYNDYRVAVEIVATVTGSAQEGDAYVRWLLIRAEELIQAHRSLLDALAAALLEHGTMNGDAVVKLFQDVIQTGQ